MAKSSLERELEKQRKLAEKQLKENKKNANKEAIIQKAASIVNGQRVIQGVKIMDKTAEDVLSALLKLELKANNQVKYDVECFPSYIGFGLSLELEKLSQYGIITSLISWMGGGILNLSPQALTYFEDKERALEMESESSNKAAINIDTINAAGGNIVFGDVVNSTISIDNSIAHIEKEIEEKGGEDKEALLELINEVKELIENIKISRLIPKQKTLFRKISNHATKHGWFYAEIVGLLGITAMQLIGN